MGIELHAENAFIYVNIPEILSWPEAEVKGNPDSAAVPVELPAALMVQILSAVANLPTFV